MNRPGWARRPPTDHNLTVRVGESAAFEDRPDHGRVLVFGHQTGGRRSLMAFVVSAREPAAPDAAPDFGPHHRNQIEETFLVRRGRLRCMLGEEVSTLPPAISCARRGLRHGFTNLSGEAVELLVSFHPGGFEELFSPIGPTKTPLRRPPGSWTTPCACSTRRSRRRRRIDQNTLA